MDVIDTGVASASENMKLDAELLETLDPQGKPLLHFYGWKGHCATYGYFIVPNQWFNLEKLQHHNVSIARRPTGGGIVFHIWDLAFSFLMPSGHPAFSLNTLENYRFVNEIILEVMKNYFVLPDSVELLPQNPEIYPSDCAHFCMAKPTQYDVMYQGLKIAGAAQRRRKQGYLHQGTISLAFPDINLLDELLLSTKDVIRAMKDYTFSPLGKNCNALDLSHARKIIQNALQEKFIEKLADIAYTGRD